MSYTMRLVLVALLGVLFIGVGVEVLDKFTYIGKASGLEIFLTFIGVYSISLGIDVIKLVIKVIKGEEQDNE